MDTITETEVRATLAPLLRTEPGAIDPDANLVVLGLSSLEIMRLVSQWRRRGVRADFEQLVAAPTLTGWLGHLTAVQAAVR